jgi:hypothetical protein
MMPVAGEGALREAQGEPGPPVAAIGPQVVAPENPVLRRIRGNRLLDQMRHSDSALQVRRTARLVGDMAAITSTLTMSFADLLFQCMAGEPVDGLQRRYHEPLQAVEILQDLCSDPLILREWHFSEEHCHLTARLLGAFTGSAGIQASPPDSCLVFSAVSHPALLDEAPFLTPIFFLLLNKDLPPLALARCLAKARFGVWSDDRRIFFPSDSSDGQGLAIRWGVITREAHDLGSVVVTFAGDRIASFRFAQPWPNARFRPGKHLMDSRFSLPTVQVDEGPGAARQDFQDSPSQRRIATCCSFLASVFWLHIGRT